jgi:3-isopropylmalate/(R)-2-methylmalate dehydratase small subunit
MEPFRKLVSKTFVIPQNNVDTDQIIPGRFLTLDDRTALGEKLFFDWRYDRDGNLRPDEPLNHVDPSQQRILIAGDNFGCGSSREHAVWALLDVGIRAVMSTSFADIFRNNALNNGLLPIVVSPQTFATLKNNPGIELTIDLKACSFSSTETGAVKFKIDPFARKLLIEGADALDYLVRHEAYIIDFEGRRING